MFADIPFPCGETDTFTRFVEVVDMRYRIFDQIVYCIEISVEQAFWSTSVDVDFIRCPSVGTVAFEIDAFRVGAPSSGDIITFVPSKSFDIASFDGDYIYVVVTVDIRGESEEFPVRRYFRCGFVSSDGNEP